MKKESIQKLRWGGRILFALYIACLIYFMFFSESYGRTIQHREYHYNLILFKEIRRFVTNWDILGPGSVLLNVAGNVGVFIPFGLAVTLLFEKVKSFLQVVVLSFSMSLLAETMQLILKVGCFDVDDLLLNTLGGCIGYLVYIWLCRRWRTKDEQKKGV